MSTLVKLDDLCLSKIYAKLSIQDMWTSGRVCVRLSGARRNCANVRRELALLIGMVAKVYIDKSDLNIPECQLLVDENGVALFPEKYQNVQLHIYSFPLDFVRLLLTHFTNLTTLTISTDFKVNELDSIIHFLEQFNRPNGTLQSLKLYSTYDKTNLSTKLDNNQNPNIRMYLRLLSAVNSIGSLRKLTLHMKVVFVRNAKYPRIDLPILAQLEEFAFNSADKEFSCLYDSFTRYAVNNQRLRWIAINIQTCDFNWLLELPTKLAASFKQLDLKLDRVNNPRFEDLCLHFSQLTSLEITFILNHVTFTHLRPLTHLPNLLSLKVSVGASFLIPSALNERGIMHFELPSVKVFSIQTVGLIRSHNFLHHCSLICVFPNVQVVRVLRQHYLCRNCQRKINGLTRSDIIELEEHCARYMFRHFTIAQHLRMVFSFIVEDVFVRLSDSFDRVYREWEWNEMEPFHEEEEDDDEADENNREE